MHLHLDRTCIIIPALNEAGNISNLVRDIHELLPVEVIVVDNGSQDATAAEAEAAGARVISEARRGYGYACAAGVLASEQAEILVFMDGDYSYLPSELMLLLEPILEDQADMVLGTRLAGGMEPGAMPPHQRLGNWLVARLMNRLYNLQITDLGPFRAIRRQLLFSLNLQEMTYGWPTEMIVKSAIRRAHIIEVPVSYRNRRAGRSKVSGNLRGTILATWFILGVTLRYRSTIPD